jgi:hypothetical protein
VRVNPLNRQDREPIKLVRVIVDEVGEPRNDGSPGSALYSVPFQLSAKPSARWVQLFLRSWDLPPRFTSMHRPGIARVINDRIILNGTTIEEVERFHVDTLKLAINEANKLEEEDARKSHRQSSALQQKRDRHRKHVAEIASRLKFEA